MTDRTVFGDFLDATYGHLAEAPTVAAGAPWAAPRATATAKPTATPARRTAHVRPTWATATCTALDDHSRLAYTEILADERMETAASFLARAHAWYTSAGITIERSGALEGSAGSSAEAVNVAPWLSVSIWVQRDWNEALRSSGPCNKRHAS